MPEQNISMKSSKQPNWFSDWISSKQLQTLKIPSHYKPTITTPLSQIPYPSDSIHCKKLYIEKSLCHLYQDFPLIHPIHIVIFTWVIGDGLGDFSAQIETAKTLIQHLPASTTITLITLHPQEMRLFSPDLSCQHFFVPYTEEKQSDWNHIPPVCFPQKVLSILQNSHVLIQIPTYFPHTKSLLAQISTSRPPAYELIGEGGWGHTLQFSPLIGARSLGLHSWEMGLFFPKQKKKNLSLHNLSDPFLQKILLKNPRNKKLFFGYMRTPLACKLFLETILKLTTQESHDLSLCLFPSEFIIQEIAFIKPLLEKANVKTVELFYETNSCLLEIQPKGKILTIIQTKKLKRSDYQILLSNAEAPIGCRGDGSLSETIVANKIPFFDLPSHKKPLLEALIAIANYYLAPNSCALSYLQEFCKQKPCPAILKALLQNTQLPLEFTILNGHLLKKHNAEKHIKNLVLRASCHFLHPEIALLEHVLLQPFFAGEKNAFTAFQEIKSLLSS